MSKKIRIFLAYLVAKWLEDLFIIAGVSVVIVTTYINFGSMVGSYLLGGVLLIVGLLIAKR